MKEEHYDILIALLKDSLEHLAELECDERVRRVLHDVIDNCSTRLIRRLLTTLLDVAKEEKENENE